MLNKFLIAAALAAAYVLGAKAGRQRYEQIRDEAMRLWHGPQALQKTPISKAAKRKARHAARKAHKAKTALRHHS